MHPTRHGARHGGSACAGNTACQYVALPPACVRKIAGIMYSAAERHNTQRFFLNAVAALPHQAFPDGPSEPLRMQQLQRSTTQSRRGVRAPSVSSDTLGVNEIAASTARVDSPQQRKRRSKRHQQSHSKDYGRGGSPMPESSRNTDGWELLRADLEHHTDAEQLSASVRLLVRQQQDAHQRRKTAPRHPAKRQNRSQISSQGSEAPSSGAASQTGTEVLFWGFEKEARAGQLLHLLQQRCLQDMTRFTSDDLVHVCWLLAVSGCPPDSAFLDQVGCVTACHTYVCVKCLCGQPRFEFLTRCILVVCSMGDPLHTTPCHDQNLC